MNDKHITIRKSHTSLSEGDHQKHVHNGWMLVFLKTWQAQVVAGRPQPAVYFMSRTVWGSLKRKRKSLQ